MGELMGLFRRWPWQRPEPGRIEDAQARVEQANSDRDAAKALRMEAERVASDAREQRRQNNYAATIRDALRGRHDRP